MRTSQHSWLALSTFAGFGLALTPAAPSLAQPRARAAPATRADIARLDKKIEDQQRRVDRLIKLQLQYLQLLTAMTDGGEPSEASSDPKLLDPRPVAAAEPKAKPAEGKPAPPADPKPRATVAAVVIPRKLRPETVGNVVGKITGAADAVVYIEDIVTTARGTATMKQENKQFMPSVLVVQRGTTVQFPNSDAIFHNVFSVTPDNSFNLGTYPQGESKNVTMARSGVVNVYCNMHPQMVGHILVVPNGNFARAGKDGFFRLTNVPAGHHRIVAWAPEAKAVATDVEVSEAEPASVELELKPGRSGPHLKKDGLPYGSYDK